MVMIKGRDKGLLFLSMVFILLMLTPVHTNDSSATCEVEFCKQCDDNITICSTCQQKYIAIEDGGKCMRECGIGYYFDERQTCSPCGEGCQECSSEQMCITCGEGYIQISMNEVKQCKRCPAYCLQCTNNATICRRCEVGYYLSENNQCLELQEGVIGVVIDDQVAYECPGGCLSCQLSTGNCKLCLEGYLNYTSSSGAERCRPCSDENCRTCFHSESSKTNSSQDLLCLECFEGFSLNNQNSTCEKCAQSSCLACHEDVNVCEKCQEGFYLIQSSCLECSSYTEGCISCNAERCFECKTGMTLLLSSHSDQNDQCIACAIGCTDCSPSNLTNCQKCSDGYHLDEGSCHACRKGCKLCQSFHICLECQKGFKRHIYEFDNDDDEEDDDHFEIEHLEQCEPMKEFPCFEQVKHGHEHFGDNWSLDPRCEKFYYGYPDYESQANSSSSVKLSPRGYFFSQNDQEEQCEELPEKCLSCDENGQCSKCSNGYYLHSDGSCQPCGYSCLLCEKPASCLKCAQGYYQQSSQCLPCDKGPSHCKTCRYHPWQCIDCENGYTRYHTICLSNIYIYIKIHLEMKLEDFPTKSNSFRKKVLSYLKQIYPLQNRTSLHIFNLTMGSTIATMGISIPKQNQFVAMRAVRNGLRSEQFQSEYPHVEEDMRVSLKIADREKNDYDPIKPDDKGSYIGAIIASIFIAVMITVIICVCCNAKKQHENQDVQQNTPNKEAGGTQSQLNSSQMDNDIILE